MDGCGFTDEKSTEWPAIRPFTGLAVVNWYCGATSLATRSVLLARNALMSHVELADTDARPSVQSVLTIAVQVAEFTDWH